MTAKDHNKLLGIFFLIYGGLQAFGGIFATLIYGGMSATLMSNARRGEEQTMGGIFLGGGNYYRNTHSGFCGYHTARRLEIAQGKIKWQNFWNYR